jgi:hypothetical protein
MGAGLRVMKFVQLAELQLTGSYASPETDAFRVDSPVVVAGGIAAALACGAWSCAVPHASGAADRDAGPLC